MKEVPSINFAVRKYWEEFYAKGTLGICTLCGNTGIIDTTLTAMSDNGIRTGLRQPCICPNGQNIRNSGEGVNRFFRSKLLDPPPPLIEKMLKVLQDCKMFVCGYCSENVLPELIDAIKDAEEYLKRPPKADTSFVPNERTASDDTMTEDDLKTLQKAEQFVGYCSKNAPSKCCFCQESGGKLEKTHTGAVVHRECWEDHSQETGLAGWLPPKEEPPRT